MCTSVATTLLAVALIVGMACCKDPDRGPPPNAFAVAATAAKVVPPASDTMPRAMAYVNSSLAYNYSVEVAPAGTIDSIALYEGDAGVALPPSAIAILCAGAAACAATSGTATVVAPATVASIRTSMGRNRTQLVFFTTTAQKAAGGAMRGTVYPYQ